MDDFHNRNKRNKSPASSDSILGEKTGAERLTTSQTRMLSPKTVSLDSVNDSIKKRSRSLNKSRSRSKRNKKNSMDEQMKFIDPNDLDLMVHNFEREDEDKEKDDSSSESTSSGPQSSHSSSSVSDVVLGPIPTNSKVYRRLQREAELELTQEQCTSDCEISQISETCVIEEVATNGNDDASEAQLLEVDVGEDFNFNQVKTTTELIMSTKTIELKETFDVSTNTSHHYVKFEESGNIVEVVKAEIDLEKRDSGELDTYYSCSSILGLQGQEDQYYTACNIEDEGQELSYYINSEQMLLKSLCDKQSLDLIVPSNSTRLGSVGSDNNNHSKSIIDHAVLEEKCRKQFLLNSINSTLKAQIIVFVNILSFLSPNDAKACRLVCRLWNQSISASSEFWSRLQITKQRTKSFRWFDLIHSDLCSVYSCPNFHFVQCDLRNLDGRQFFKTHGNRIKSLKLSKCTFSMATLQMLMKSLPYLEYLEIIGLSASILVSESIHPTTNKHKPGFAFLTCLILQNNISHIDKLLEKSKLVKPIPRNLNQNILLDLLLSCKLLKTVKLIGWESQTYFDLLQILYFKLPSSTLIEELRFLNISLKNFTFDHFYPLRNSFDHIQLKKLSICLQKGCWDKTKTKTSGPAFTASFYNLDDLMRDIIETHLSTLIELDLDHCPVSPDIFNIKLPRKLKLSKLSIHGTKIDGDQIKKILKKLNVVKYTANKKSDFSTASDFPDHNDDEDDNKKKGHYSHIYLGASSNPSSPRVGSSPYYHLNTAKLLCLAVILCLFVFLIYYLQQLQEPHYSSILFVVGIVILKFLLFSTLDYL